MAEQAKQPLVVTVSGDRPIREVAKDLAKAGLEVDQILESIGVVTGRANPSAVARLRRVSGVADVSSDNPVDIGPPDSEVS
jgi:hypothetical protein